MRGNGKWKKIDRTFEGEPERYRRRRRTINYRSLANRCYLSSPPPLLRVNDDVKAIIIVIERERTTVDYESTPRAVLFADRSHTFAPRNVEPGFIILRFSAIANDSLTTR